MAFNFPHAKAAMDQFVDGLRLAGVADYVHNFPELMKDMFCPTPSTLTAGVKKHVADLLCCAHLLNV